MTANYPCQAAAEVEGAVIDIEFEARRKVLVACLVGGEDGSLKRAGGEGGFDGIEGTGEAGDGDHLLDGRVAEAA